MMPALCRCAQNASCCVCCALAAIRVPCCLQPWSVRLASYCHQNDRNCISIGPQVFAPTAEQFKAAEQAVLAVSGGNLTVRATALNCSVRVDRPICRLLYAPLAAVSACLLCRSRQRISFCSYPHRLSWMQPGTRYAAKVVKIMDYGAFVELTGGTQGLLHISEIATEKARLLPWQHASQWGEGAVVLAYP